MRCCVARSTAVIQAWTSLVEVWGTPTWHSAISRLRARRRRSHGCVVVLLIVGHLPHHKLRRGVRRRRVESRQLVVRLEAAEGGVVRHDYPTEHADHCGPRERWGWSTRHRRCRRGVGGSGFGWVRRSRVGSRTCRALVRRQRDQAEITLCTPTGDNGDAGVSPSILARDSVSKVPVNDAAGIEGAAPAVAPPGSEVAGVPDAWLEPLAGSAIDEALAAGDWSKMWWSLWSMGSGAWRTGLSVVFRPTRLTMVGLVPVVPRAHVPTPPNPYWLARRAIWYIEVRSSKKVSCHWLPT